MTSRTVAAVDLGAESGRVTAVSFDGTRLTVDIANRFPNGSRPCAGLLRWPTEELWTQISAGLGILAAGDRPISAVGVDTWGVDYGLLSQTGELIDDPVSYRDDRNTRSLADALALLGPDRSTARPVCRSWPSTRCSRSWPMCGTSRRGSPMPARC